MGVKTSRAATLLLLETLVCLLFGVTGTTTDLFKNPPHLVNGIRGRPGLLPVNLPRGKKARSVEWIYQTEGIWIATFEGRTFNRSHHRDRFGQRLQMVGDTTLRIQELQMEDRGTYMARASLGSTGVRDQTFNLRVYEPVPEPQITFQKISDSPKGCNLTLRCQAFENGVLNISWEMGNPPRMLEGTTDWYQLSANGSDLHVSWRPSFSEANVTCRASNPGDQKTASFDLCSVCSSKGGDQSGRAWPIFVVLGVLAFILVAPGGVWLLKRRRKRQPRKTEQEGCP